MFCKPVVYYLLKKFKVIIFFFEYKPQRNIVLKCQIIYITQNYKLNFKKKSQKINIITKI